MVPVKACLFDRLCLSISVLVNIEIFLLESLFRKQVPWDPEADLASSLSVFSSLASSLVDGSHLQTSMGVDKG